MVITFNRKIVVLDDDPTGVQTVHGVNVYTDWDYESIYEGFCEENKMFFILTNSRSFSKEKTEAIHKEIAINLVEASKATGKKFILISRGDSTLRGHYPLETEVLRNAIQEESDEVIDGEIIYPFFLEGGRITSNNTHYVKQNNTLVPVGETEFAKDKTFSFKSSNLIDWVEEQTNNKYTADYISLEDLRGGNIDIIVSKLLKLNNFEKLIVNSETYEDVKVFLEAFLIAVEKKNYILRTAASFTKIIGGISDRELLTKEELGDENNNGGLIIIGSHVSKTSEQLEELITQKDIVFIEFNQHLVVNNELLQEEVRKTIEKVENSIGEGRTVAVYTRRDKLDLNKGNKEDELNMSVKISEAITSIVKNLVIRPKFIIAKGGITSSDIGVKGLGVKKALVLGQISAGIPVWKTGEETKFPGLSYIIFPGNVGDKNTLSDIVKLLK